MFLKRAPYLVRDQASPPCRGSGPLFPSIWRGVPVQLVQGPVTAWTQRRSAKVELEPRTDVALFAHLTLAFFLSAQVPCPAHHRSPSSDTDQLFPSTAPRRSGSSSPDASVLFEHLEPALIDICSPANDETLGPHDRPSRASSTT